MRRRTKICLLAELERLDVLELNERKYFLRQNRYSLNDS
jgi:hypothetical protein